MRTSKIYTLSTIVSLGITLLSEDLRAQYDVSGYTQGYPVPLMGPYDSNDPYGKQEDFGDVVLQDPRTVVPQQRAGIQTRTGARDVPGDITRELNRSVGRERASSVRQKEFSHPQRRSFNESYSKGAYQPQGQNQRYGNPMPSVVSPVPARSSAPVVSPTPSVRPVTPPVASAVPMASPAPSVTPPPIPARSSASTPASSATSSSSTSSRPTPPTPSTSAPSLSTRSGAPVVSAASSSPGRTREDALKDVTSRLGNKTQNIQSNFKTATTEKGKKKGETLQNKTIDSATSALKSWNSSSFSGTREAHIEHMQDVHDQLVLMRELEEKKKSDHHKNNADRVDQHINELHSIISSERASASRGSI